jgi:subtilisin family serine protease
MIPKKIILASLALALALGACADAGTGPSAAAGAAPLHARAGALAGEYVVVLKDGADPRAVAAVAGVEARHVYTAALTGFSASLNAGQLTALRHHPSVELVEADGPVQAAWVQNNAPWGLDRIDQHYLPLNSTYVYNTLASNVHAYVIDTGIHTAHPQFGGRATNVFDAFGGNGQDCNGHGTGVAGIVGASTYGVAKGVRLYGLRALNCSGSGTISGIIAAVDWVRVNHRKPAVANLSLGGGASSALNTAVTNLYNAGVFVAVAAGNSNANACNFSPSGATNATTAAASTATDQRVTSSNWGSCVDLYAPGQNVPTVGLNGSVTTGGSSLAAPHVAGVAALYLATFGGAAPQARAWILNNATPNVIGGNPAGTPNRLLYKGTL